MIADLILAQLPAVVAGGDDPSALERWTAGRSFDEILVEVVADFPRGTGLEILALIGDPDVAGFVIVHDEHPYLDEILAWVRDHPEVCLLASPSGPTPPAACILEQRS